MDNDVLLDIQLLQEETRFTISLPTEPDNVVEELKEASDAVEESENEFIVCELVEEDSQQIAEDDLGVESFTMTEVNTDIAEEQLTEEEFLKAEYEVPTKIRKKPTLNDLTEQQIAWVRQQAFAGENAKDKKNYFNCTVCLCKLSTQASLTRHLRDVHVLKSDADSNRSALKSEVKNSKLLIETVNGNETIWKCQRCENDRIYKCEQSFKLHIRMTHIRATKIDTAFVAACKTSIMEKNVPRDVWKCPDCSRILRHRDSLRHHIKIEHPNMDENETKHIILHRTKTQSDETSNEMISRIAQRLEEKEVGKSLNYCQECGLKFAVAKHYLKPKVHRDCHDTLKVLAPHMLHHKCEPCQMIFNEEDSLSEHLRVHGNPENIQPIQAEGLSKYGASFYKVPTGDADDAMDEVVWKCGHCPVRYFGENDLFTHIMLLHSNQLYCFVDNREFTGSGGMSKFTQHMKNKHPELFPNVTYPCGSCKHEFASIYDKLGHQKFCSTKKFKCDYCGKLY